MGLRWKSWAVVGLLIASPAAAQQQGSPIEQAMGAKLIAEISSGVQCSASLIDMQKQLEAAKAQIKDLEAKAAKPN